MAYLADEDALFAAIISVIDREQESSSPVLENSDGSEVEDCELYIG